MAQEGYSTGVALTGALVLTAIVACGALLINGERMAANILIAHTVAVANGGDLDRAEQLANRISFFSSDVRSEQVKTNIGIAKLSAILGDEKGDPEALRTQFQDELAKTIGAAG